MGKKFRLGLIQVERNHASDLASRQKHLLTLTEECLKAGADIVVMPEMFQYTDGKAILQDLAALKEINKDWKARCAALAKQYSAYVVPWDVEVGDNEEYYNSSYILDRQGSEVGRFRKVQITYGEIALGYTPGNDFPVFDLDFGRVGIMICYDAYYVESARILGLRGAEVILYPLYGDALKIWETKTKARAADNSVYVVSVQMDHYFDVSYTGLINPHGELVTKLTAVNTWQVVDVDLTQPFENIIEWMNPKVHENTRELLHLCRRENAYAPLLSPIKKQTIEEVYYGHPPKFKTRD